MGVAGVLRGAVPFAALACMCVAGCAQITVVSEKAPPKTEYRFGVLTLDLGRATENTIVHSRGVGIVSTPNGATLGYANAKIVRMGDDCRVVIATKDLEALSRDPELRRRLRTTHKACAA